MKPIEDFILRVVVDAVHYRNILTLDNYEQGWPIQKIEPGDYRFKIHVAEQNFRPGAYTFNVAVVKKHAGVHLFLWMKCARLVVLSPQNIFLYSDPNAVMHLDVKFSHEALETLS